MKSIRESRPALEVAGYLAHAKTQRFQKRIEDALGIIRRGLDAAPDAYVSCSFGKDSAVMYHLCATIQPNIEARFIRWQESNLLDNYDDVIGQWLALGMNLSILDMERATLNDSTKDRWQQLESLAHATGYFVGLRMEESRGRKISLAKDGSLYQKKSGMWRICPIARWHTEDVAAYIVSHDLPTLNTYHVEGFNARTASRVPRQEVRGQSLSALRQRDPDAFEALAAKFPEVKEWV